MANATAWFIFVLGVMHIGYGLIKFRAPLAEAVSTGFVGKFRGPSYAAFWFLIAGPLLMLAGHAAIHAVAAGDHVLLRILGAYMLPTSIVGVAAFPKSPFWAVLLASPLLVAAGYGALP